MRRGKITSSGPILALNFLKKNKEVVEVVLRFGKTLERDIVDINTAKKACMKANIEGQVLGISQTISLISRIVKNENDKNIAIIQLNQLRDSIMGQSI